MSFAASSTRKATWWPLVGLLVLTLGIGAIGSIITSDAIPTWYRTLDKPSWTPPNWVFAPVWTTLYILMAVACHLIWTLPRSRERSAALTWFFVQLFFNAIWTPVFFGLHATGAGLLVIALLAASLLVTMVKFLAIRPVAGWLLVPYLVWICYAASLNWGIWRLNG